MKFILIILHALRIGNFKYLKSTTIHAVSFGVGFDWNPLRYGLFFAHFYLFTEFSTYTFFSCVNIKGVFVNLI